MAFLKWTLGIVVGLAAVLLVGGLMLSGNFQISRSVVVAAPADKVYPLVAEPKRWKDWSVWNRRDPAMAITYSGPESGAGARWEWKSPTEGDGRMTFTAAEPGKRAAYELFFPEFGTTSTGELTLTPEGSGTRVTWSMQGTMGSNPLMRWMALAMDRMVGPDFEGGLANLKTLAEKG
jgi:uncharacterized protein YndB with AHSA1/START domain